MRFAWENIEIPKQYINDRYTPWLYNKKFDEYRLSEYYKLWSTSVKSTMPVSDISESDILDILDGDN